jgi:uncharacterized membrane protein
MATHYWNDLYVGWGWFLWIGVFFLFASSIGNWGYTYQAHRRYSDVFPKLRAFTILDERLARGEISREEYRILKAEISDEGNTAPKKSA